MELPPSWRREVESGGGLLLWCAAHLVAVAFIVGEVWIWGLLPADDPALSIGAKIVTFAMVAVLLAEDALSVASRVRRFLRE